MKINKILLIGLLLGLVAVLVTTCDRDCPSCPDDNPRELIPCRLYAYDYIHQFLMSVDIPADTIVDSVRLDFTAFGMALTADGNKLILQNDEAARMDIFDAHDLSFIGSLDKEGVFYFDEDVALFTVGRDSNVYFIDPITLTPLDTLNMYVSSAGYLDTANNLFYSSASDRGMIYIIDAENRILVDSFATDSRPRSLVFSPIADGVYYHCFAGVYFRGRNDSEDYEIGATTYGLGGIAMTADGKTVYFTDGGQDMFGMFPTGDLWVVDAQTHQVTEMIPALTYVTDPYLGPPLFGSINITPDQRRAYLGSSSQAGNNVPIAVFDLEKERLIKTITPFEYFSASLTVLGSLPD